jgi:hypothetical protein
MISVLRDEPAIAIAIAILGAEKTPEVSDDDDEEVEEEEKDFGEGNDWNGKPHDKETPS